MFAPPLRSSPRAAATRFKKKRSSRKKNRPDLELAYFLGLGL
jgi:hypothetical protein